MIPGRASRLIAVGLAITFLSSPLVLRADAGQSAVFHAAYTEEFGFFGCPDGVNSDFVDTCGTGQAHPFGHALIGTVITGFSRLPSGCFHDSHETTLDFGEKGSLIVDIDAALCPTGGQNFTLSGTYEVVGGTGIFATAQGSGDVVSVRQNGPIHSELDGNIRLR